MVTKAQAETYFSQNKRKDLDRFFNDKGQVIHPEHEAVYSIRDSIQEFYILECN